MIAPGRMMIDGRPPNVTARSVDVTIDAGENDAAILSITDNGPGIAPEQQAQIWTPFYTTKQQGTGLGLPFVREIITDHGGTISVESVVGSGATFRIRLPRLPSQE